MGDPPTHAKSVQHVNGATCTAEEDGERISRATSALGGERERKNNCFEDRLSEYPEKTELCAFQ